MKNKKRLIDANKLMEHLTRCIDAEKGLFRAVCVAIKCFVEQMPTVDAVEVVRCKDCRWRKERGLCYMISGTGVGTGTGDDFFCSYGERKENDI